MKKLVKVTEIRGEIIAPSSKSAAQRAIVAALLTGGTCLLRGLTLCDDTRYALEWVEACGARMDRIGQDYRIETKGDFRCILPDVLYCGESALLTRMTAPIVALSDRRITLHGSGSLLNRPMDMVEQSLRQLGVSVESHSGYLPLVIQGPFHGGKISMDASISSQVLTGLLMALPLAGQDSEIQVQGLVSKPYVDMTLAMLSSFGVQVDQESYRLFHVRGRQSYCPFDITLEKDWSAASCLLVAGCLAGEVCVPGLSLTTRQADVAILEVLTAAGAKYRIVPTGDTCKVITSKQPLHAFDFDATDCPDLFPAIVALASASKGTSRIRGIHRLLHKESDRARTLEEEFEKIGIRVVCSGEIMYITGGPVHGASVYSHGDHRIAMALAVTALRSPDPVCVEGAEAVTKSYPEFWENIEK